MNRAFQQGSVFCAVERFTNAVARPSSLVRVVYCWRVPRRRLWLRNALNAAFEADALPWASVLQYAKLAYVCRVKNHSPAGARLPIHKFANPRHPAGTREADEERNP